jgi:hypothetical protein
VQAWAAELDRGLAPPAGAAPPGQHPGAGAPISETRALEVLSLLEQSEVRRSRRKTLMVACCGARAA